MPPAYIRTLLHIYYRCEPLEAAPITQESVKSFIASKLIEPDYSSESGYKITERGTKLVQMWCDTPLPEPCYVDPRLKCSNTKTNNDF